MRSEYVVVNNMKQWYQGLRLASQKNWTIYKRSNLKFLTFASLPKQVTLILTTKQSYAFYLIKNLKFKLI